MDGIVLKSLVLWQGPQPFLTEFCIHLRLDSCAKCIPGFFFEHSEKNSWRKKTQNSRKKLKLKLTTQIFGIFRKNNTFSEKMFYPS